MQYDNHNGHAYPADKMMPLHRLVVPLGGGWQPRKLSRLTRAQRKADKQDHNRKARQWRKRIEED